MCEAKLAVYDAHQAQLDGVRRLDYDAVLSLWLVTLLFSPSLHVFSESLSVSS